MSRFNPYSEWLGIQANDQPTYYQLLGVSPSETDLKVILTGAKRQLKKLESVDGDEVTAVSRRRLKDKLKRRIRRAAKCLTDPSLRREYDARLISELSTASSSDSMLLVEEDVAVSESVSVDTNAKKKSSVSSRYRRTHEQSRVLWLCGILVLASLAGIAFLLFTQSDVGRQLVGLPLANPSPSTDSEPKPKSKSSTNLQTESQPSLKEEDDYPEPSVNPTREVTTVEPKPRPVVPTREPTDDELRALGNLFQAAREALKHRDFTTAKGSIQQAKPLVLRTADREKLERLAILTEYVEEYWKALDQAWAKLKAGEELVLLGTRSMIVEANGEELLLRTNGRNQKLIRKELPLKMQVALADSWFEQDASSTKVFRGAMMSVTPEYGPEKARKLWQEAANEGVELHDLELVLDDDYQLVE